MNDEQRQQRLIELQIFNQQGEQLRQHLIYLEEQMDNLKKLKENLDAISKENNGKEMYMPLSSGVFVKTELKDNDEVLVGIGAGVVVKKKIKDAQEMLVDQENKMRLVIMQLRNEFEKFVNSAVDIEKELSAEQ